MRTSAVVLLILMAGCTGSGNQDEPVRFQDVHGLAIDPKNPAVLYVATHHGLYRGVNDQEWAKVGTDTMDLMGFTMHPTDANVFYASGHPSRPNRDYNALGIIKSTDGGQTWTTLALRNQVDFHAMTISLADPDQVWAYYYRDNHFYVSSDAGTTWSHEAPTAPAPQINSLASHASNDTTVYAGTNDGVWTSNDVGMTWRKLSGNQPAGPAGAVATSVSDPALVWAYYPSVGVAYSRDGGLNWTAAPRITLANNDAPSVIAIDPTDTSVAYVASGRGAVYKSTGGPWTQIQSAPS